MYRAVSERGEAGLGRLKSTIYARMEDMSFRSGAAISAGVLAAGVAITLAVALGGHSGAAPSAPRPAAVARSTPPPPATLPAAAPSAAPAASLMPVRGHKAAATVTAPQVLASSAPSGPTPWFLHHIHIHTGRFFPMFPNLGGPGSLSRAGAPEWRHDGRLDRDGRGLFGWRPGRLRL
jgi:hypothetical protein